MKRRGRSLRRRYGHTILTDDRGRPVERPERKDFASDIDFIDAFHAYKNKIAQIANAAFDDSFRKSLKRRKSK